jgi:2-amino-4-hydroxy-6-hydroxymethyldihydropteridine diphosphokinase
MIEKELFILLGTNLGDRNANFETAINEIQMHIGSIKIRSHCYETAAWGITDQPNFLNQILQVETNLSPNKALKIILKIEKKMGRIREQKWGARLIDIDILYFGNKIMDTESLKIPHPFLQERRFTIIPLVEIAPDFIHPIFNKSNKMLLEECEDNSDVILIVN